MRRVLQARHVSKKGEDGFLLSGINFSQDKLEKVAIAGETGAGKSTLLKLIAGLLQPDGGEILFEGQKIIGPDEQLVPGHPGIAYLSQHFELQKSLRVEQVLAYSNNLTDGEADNLFKVCRIDHLAARGTDQLSGGEKQRVAVCRLLISRPRLLLLDEPFSHLDMVHKRVLKSVIRDIGEKLGITCILVSHDPRDTLSWADKILVMKDGTIVQEGTPESVYRMPVNEYTGALFGNFNLIQKESFRTFSRLRPIKEFIQRGGVRSIFLRPESFRLVRKSPSALRGKVEAVLFCGSHSEVHVRIAKTIITVYTTVRDLRAGDVVYISIADRRLWSL